MNRKIRTTLLVMLALIGLTACGGGGGGGATPTHPPTGSSNWDSLIWDQGNWV